MGRGRGSLKASTGGWSGGQGLLGDLAVPKGAPWTMLYNNTVLAEGL